MKTVKVEKALALTRIKANYENHKKIVIEATEGYKRALMKQLEDKLVSLKAGKKVSQKVSLMEPQDMSKEYERVLDMLNSTNESVIEMTEQEFRQYMRDEWSWKDQFLLSNKAYSMMAAGAAAGDEEDDY